MIKMPYKDSLSTSNSDCTVTTTTAKAAACLDPVPVMILICSLAAGCRCARRTGSSVGNQDGLIPGPVSRLSPATSSHPCVVCRDHPVIHTIHIIHIHNPHPCVGCLVTGFLSASVDDDISASAAEICDADGDMSIMSSD